ncbi:MAG TPA: hypothetical protein VMM12_05450 [Longimicrobiales bacterium]|nr:hypothetical protein [Longimicrobiales bacterium]
MTKWSLLLTHRAEKDLRELSSEDSDRVMLGLARLAIEGAGDIRRLKHVDPPEWRLRVGDVRVRLTYRPDEKEIIALRILPRGKAYR